MRPPLLDASRSPLHASRHAAQDVPALQRKLVFTLLFPLAWFYTTAVVLQRHAWCALQLYVCAWFLVGFIVAHRFAC